MAYVLCFINSWLENGAVIMYGLYSISSIYTRWIYLDRLHGYIEYTKTTLKLRPLHY